MTKGEEDSLSERNGEAIPEPLTRHSQSNLFLGFGLPATLGVDRGGTGYFAGWLPSVVWGQGVRGRGHIGTSKQEFLEVMEASLDRNFLEEFECWIVECDEATLALRNSCTWAYTPSDRPRNLD